MKNYKRLSQKLSLTPSMMQHFASEKKIRNAKWVAASLLIVLLLSGITGWYWHTVERTDLLRRQSAELSAWEAEQPVTPAQIRELTAIAEMAAQKQKLSRHKIWNDLKILLNVRRIEQIKRGDFDKAKEILLARTR
ncbi:MAG: hypothetical protein HQL64_06665 [Magnetococcales bacterium]|nr:hypothetical protein [Magnetococcales bacterium]